ncbi:MAG: response regulator [Planctomycetota bacterium]
MTDSRGEILIVGGTAEERRVVCDRVEMAGHRPIAVEGPDEVASSLTERVFEAAVCLGGSSVSELKRRDEALCTIVVDGVDPDRPPDTFWTALESARAKTLRTRRLLGPTPDRAWIESCPDALWAIDADLRFVAANEATARLYGRPLDDLIGRPILEFLAGSERSWSDEAFEVVLTEERPFSCLERTVPGPKSAARLVETSACPRHDESGRFLGYCGIDRDVTDRSTAERQRRAREARRHEEQQNRALQSFAGAISHDLSNVLTAVLGYAQMAAESGDDESRSSALTQIRSVANQALELGHKLALVASHGERASDPFDLGELVRRLTERRSRAVLSVDAQTKSFWLRGDAGQLESALNAILDNAEEAATSGPVQILLGREELAGGPVVRLCVLDEGPGIDPRQREDLFSPFTTSKPRNIGTGLGLTLARSLIREHGGTIVLENRREGGTRCVISLPLVERETVKKGAVRPDAILIAEDHDHVRHLVGEALGAAGLPIRVAADGDEALRLVETRAAHFRFAILDVDLPGHSGVEVLKALRRKNPNVPVLLITGRADSLSHEQLPPNVDVLSKPFRLEQLVERARAALGLTPLEPHLEAEHG